MFYRGGKRLKSRRAADTAAEASYRSHASGSGDGGRGPVGGLAEIAAGALGAAATWVASTGSRAAGREAQTPRLVGACERQVRVFVVEGVYIQRPCFFGGGALRCLPSSEIASPKTPRLAGAFEGQARVFLWAGLFAVKAS
jgi:hypothetical protein